MIKSLSLLSLVFLLGCNSKQEDKSKHLYPYRAKAESDFVWKIDSSKNNYDFVPKVLADEFDRIIKVEYLPNMDSANKILIINNRGFRQGVQKIQLKSGFELYILHLQSSMLGDWFYGLIWKKSDEKITGKFFSWFAQEYNIPLPFQLLHKPYISFNDSTVLVKSFATNGNVYHAVIEHYLDYQGIPLINIESFSIMRGGEPMLVTRKFDPNTMVLTTFVDKQKVGIVTITEENGKRVLFKNIIDDSYKDILVTNNGIITDEKFLGLLPNRK